MSIDTPPIPPGDESTPATRKRNTSLDFLYGLIIVLVVIGGTIGLLSSPGISELGSLLGGLREKIDQGLSFDFLENLQNNPSQENQPYEPDLNGDDSVYVPGSGGSYGADEIPLGIYDFATIGISFSYPLHWEIEVEDNTVTFYHPEDLVFLYIGEFELGAGDSAKEVAMDFLLTIEEDAEQDTLNLISAASYPVAVSDDAYLVLFEWVDDEGDYAWAYDLEIVSGESNLFILLYGAEPDDMSYYGELLDIIAVSMISLEE